MKIRKSLTSNIILLIVKQKLPLCQCGCGKEVLKINNKYINGHNKKPYLGKKHPKKLNQKPPGLCQCGCGKKVSDWWCKFIYGHSGILNKGKKGSEESKRKRKVTCRLKYGVENPMQNMDIQNKEKKTMLNRHGYEYPMKSKEIQKKHKSTCKEKFGVENPIHSKELREKSKKTCLDHYGVECSLQSKEIREKIKQRLLQNHGVDNYSKTFEFRKSARERMIHAIEMDLKDGQKFTPRKGNNEKPFISELQKYTSLFIDNDAKLIGYFPDGYIKELNLVIEFDEPWHDLGCWVARDKIKDEDYTKCGYIVFRVKEKDWNENREIVIENFKKVVI